MTSTDGIVIDGRLMKRATCAGRSRPRWCSRTRPSTRRCSRWPAAASSARAWATTATTWPWSPTSPATTSGLGGIDTARPAGQRQGRGGRGRAAIRDGGPQRRRHAGLPDGPPLRRPGDPVLDVQGRRARTASTASTATPRRGNAAFCLEDTPQGELMVAAPRAAQDAGPVHAPHARRRSADGRG